MTEEHLKPILDSARDAELLCQAAELLAWASIPEEVLSSEETSFGGWCPGPLRSRSERRWKRPRHLCALSRAGCECIAHAIQAMTDANPRCTVLSVDGIGAHDTISRRAMLSGWCGIWKEETVLPFVLQFSGSPSSYLWEDSEGVVHEVLQGEGGEQGDALMPALFSLGQHDTLVAIQGRLAG